LKIVKCCPWLTVTPTCRRGGEQTRRRETRRHGDAERRRDVVQPGESRCRFSSASSRLRWLTGIHECGASLLASPNVPSFPRSRVGAHAPDGEVFFRVGACVRWVAARVWDAGASRNAFPRRSVGTRSNAGAWEREDAGAWEGDTVRWNGNAMNSDALRFGGKLRYAIPAGILRESGEMAVWLDSRQKRAGMTTRRKCQKRFLRAIAR